MKKILLFACAIAFVCSCGKDTSTIPASKSSALIQNWQPVSATLNVQLSSNIFNNVDTTIDIYNQLTSCQKLFYFSLNNNSIAKFATQTGYCDSIKAKTGSWSMLTSSNLYISFPIFYQTLAIQQLSNTTDPNTYIIKSDTLSTLTIYQTANQLITSSTYTTYVPAIKSIYPTKDVNSTLQNYFKNNPYATIPFSFKFTIVSSVLK